jgi:hypothetical protein
MNSAQKGNSPQFILYKPIIEFEHKYVIDEKELFEDYICHFCMNIVKNPRMCKKCENLFCIKCLKKYWSVIKMEICPLKCFNLNHFLATAVPRLVTNSINRLKFKCPNSEDCTAKLTYITFEQHILQCKYIQLKVICNYCQIQINMSNAYEHVNSCLELPKECTYCKLIIPMKNYLSHKDTCLGIMVLCLHCDKKFSLRDIKEHFKNKNNIKLIN